MSPEQGVARGSGFIRSPARRVGARRLLTLLLAGALTTACSGPAVNLPPAPPRPRDPWVLRCALDEHPRTLVVALSDDLWLAYDTTACMLAKAWRGDVNLDEPADTTVQEPKATTRGDDLHDPFAGATWHLAPYQPARVEFAGYTLSDGRVTLEWCVWAPHGASHEPYGAPLARVHETPEVMRDGAGRVVLLRRFEVSTLLAQELLLTVPRLPKVAQQPELSFSGTEPWLMGVAFRDGELSTELRLARGTGLIRTIYPGYRTP